MAKKVIFELNQLTVATLSNFNVALEKIKAENNAHKKALAPLEKELSEIMAKRQVAIDQNGKSLNEAVSLYPSADIQGKIDSECSRHSSALKPLYEAKRKAVGYVPVELYEAFCYAWDSGDVDGIGSYDVTYKNKVTTTRISKSYKDSLCEFALSLGAKNTEYDGAMIKFINAMNSLISGTTNSSKGERLTKVKSRQSFNEAVVRAIIDYLVCNRKVLSKAEDGTLTVVEYND